MIFLHFRFLRVLRALDGRQDFRVKGVDVVLESEY